MTERRSRYRRDDDTETHEIAEASVDNAWFLTRFSRLGKFATAALSILGLIAVVMSAANYRLVGSRADIITVKKEMKEGDSTLNLRLDTNNAITQHVIARQDSMFRLLERMDIRMEQQQFVLCFMSKVGSGVRLPDQICKG